MLFDPSNAIFMNSNQNRSPSQGHNMDTDHDPLDLLDIAEWNAEDLQTSDHYLSLDSQHSPSHQTDKFGEVFAESRYPDPSSDLSVSTEDPNGMMNFGMKKPVIPTITTIYEPKFFEVFQAYQQFVQQYEPNIKNYGIVNTHLMTLCLNNLLPFSNWAREANNGLFIRGTLFENPDMRPEVRNGLAMILVYVFSAAKANEMRLANPNSNSNIDMFTVLMKADTGLGIVNKTSLKIYSDPFGFFNFIKACLSGLIDASAIPENERLNNQQTKRTRRGSRNKDEVESYDYLKNSLVALFEVPDSLQLAKNRILQILNFWHVKGKSIRTERFSAVYSMMPTTPGGPTINIPDDTMSVSTETKPRLSNRSSGGNIADAGAYISAMQSGMVWDNESMYEESVSSNSPHPSFYGENSARNSGLRPSNYTVDRTSSRDDNAVNEWRSTNASQLQTQQMLYLLQNRIVSVPVPTIRFDRVGSVSWAANNTFLYDFDELQKSTYHTTFYLIDEVKLKNFFYTVLGKRPPGSGGSPEEELDFFGIFRFTVSEQMAAHGLTSIDKIVAKSGAVVTAWTQADFPQMKIFVNGWKAQSIQSSNSVGVPPPPPTEDTLPVLSPTNSMMANMETFNIGSSPADGKRLSKRRSSSNIDLKKDIAQSSAIKNAMGLMNPQAGNPSSSNNSRGQSMSGKSELSPMATEMRNPVDLSSAFSPNAPPALSMIEYWNLLRNQQLGSENSAARSPGRGIIVFERSAEVGLIIRANPKFNIQEDIWCLFYVDDAVQYFMDQIRRSTEQITPLHMSFGAFLVHLLPQTRILFQYLQHEQAYQQVNMRQQHNPFQFTGTSSGMTVSYYAHRVEGMNMTNPLQSVSENGPPVALMNSQYRTIGTFDQNFQQILSKFSNDCYFHDINLA